MNERGSKSGRRWLGAALAAVAVAIVVGALAGGPRPDAPPPAGRAAAPAGPPQAAVAGDPASGAALEARRRPYLERSYQQLRRLERAIGEIGAERHAHAALAAAALGESGQEIARHAAAAVDECVGRWHKAGCERGALPLQRLVLQFPEALAPELAARLRRELGGAAAPPPAKEQIRDPWDFRQTENQRVLTLARSLVGERLAGREGARAERAWGAYAEAFLGTHDRDGWYEAESPGYLAISMEGLLHLADFAPDEKLRRLAERQLHLRFAAWAQQQVGGFPAGAKSRTYVHWALSPKNTPWQAWAWLLAGVGDPGEINFMDWPELAVARYRVPEPARQLVARRRQQGEYEIRVRRRIEPARRRNLDTALYAYATPDYVLGAAQSVGRLRLGVSGGQEIVATLYPEGGDFAPVYLWSRTANPRSDRWKSWAGQDLAVAHENHLVARLGQGAGGGHVYLAPAWEEPRVIGDVVVTRYGNTFLALTTAGGWEVAPARQRYGGLYRDRELAGARVLLPRRQPASIGLTAGRAAEISWEDWTKKAARARLTVAEGTIRYAATGGPTLTFAPGRRAEVDGQPLDPASYPLLEGPFLASAGDGRWEFTFQEIEATLPPILAASKESP